MPADYAQIIRSLRKHDVDFIIIGASAAIAQGAPISTIDLDLGYRRTRENIERLVAALRPFHPRLRGIDESIPFTFGANSIRKGCNFTFVTDAGDLDLLGHIAGVGDYEAMITNAVRLRMFGYAVLVMELEDVIRSKRAAGRAKDQAVLPVLEETLKLRRSHSPEHE